MALTIQNPYSATPAPEKDPVTGQYVFGGAADGLLQQMQTPSPAQKWANSTQNTFTVPPPPLSEAQSPLKMAGTDVSPLLYAGKTQATASTTPQTQAPGYLSTPQGQQMAASGLQTAANGASAQGGPQFASIGSGLGMAAGSAAGPGGAVAGGAAGAALGGLLDWWISSRDAEKREKAAKAKEQETRRWQEMYMAQERKAGRQADQRFANEMSSADLALAAQRRQVADAMKASIQGVLQRRANRAGYGTADNVVSSPIGNGQVQNQLQGAF